MRRLMVALVVYVFDDTVTLDEGLYRLAIEENRGVLTVELAPAAAPE